MAIFTTTLDMEDRNRIIQNINKVIQNITLREKNDGIYINTVRKFNVHVT